MGYVPIFRMKMRLHNVDALRGFALLGILAVNIWSFADPYFASGLKNPLYASPLDVALRFLAALLFEAKFYLLFSFLFGYSFTLQMDAAERDGAAFRPRMLRRALGLFVMGLLHGCLLFYGDILNLYGMLSLLLVMWRHLTPRQALWRAPWLLALAAAMMLALGVLVLLDGAGAPNLVHIAARRAAFHGSAGATLAFTAGEFPSTMALLMFGQGPSALAMFLFGFASGRSRLLAHAASYRPYLPRVLRTCLPLGMAGAIAYATASEFAPGGAAMIFATAVSYLTAPLLTASYVAGLLLLFDSAGGACVVRWLAPMGRMALSNYLMQSLLLNLLFTGYGLRLCDRLPPAAVMGVVLAIFLLQMLASAWWLRRHTYGPAERVLRAVTLGVRL